VPVRGIPCGQWCPQKRSFSPRPEHQTQRTTKFGKGRQFQWTGQHDHYSGRLYLSP
jgi:hypothetical protein